MKRGVCGRRRARAWTSGRSRSAIGFRRSPSLWSSGRRSRGSAGRRRPLGRAATLEGTRMSTPKGRSVRSWMRRICASRSVGRESGSAEHAESTGVGDGCDEFGSGDASLASADGRSHAGQGDGVFDVQEVAHLGVEDRSGHSAPVNRRNAEVVVCIVPASTQAVNLFRVSRVLPSTGGVGSKMSACGYV